MLGTFSPPKKYSHLTGSLDRWTTQITWVSNSNNALLVGQNHQTKKYQQHFKLRVFDSPPPKRVPFVHEQTCALANPVINEVLGPLHMAFIGPFNDPLQMTFVTVCFFKVIVYFLTMVESPFSLIIWGIFLSKPKGSNVWYMYLHENHEHQP